MSGRVLGLHKIGSGRLGDVCQVRGEAPKIF
jgi:hypothetical protein